MYIKIIVLNIGYHKRNIMEGPPLQYKSTMLTSYPRYIVRHPDILYKTSSYDMKYLEPYLKHVFSNRCPYKFYKIILQSLEVRLEKKYVF